MPSSVTNNSGEKKRRKASGKLQLMHFVLINTKCFGKVASRRYFPFLEIRIGNPSINNLAKEMM